MSFEFVWGLIESPKEPPYAIEFKEMKNGYKFYPLQHEGLIFTADYSFWRDQTIATVNYYPSANEIAQIFLNHKFENNLLIILSDAKSANTIDPNRLVELSKIPVDVKDSFKFEFVDAGFDVIDISGISALTNVGYSSSDLASLDNSFQITEFGLISLASDAGVFANFASSVAPEHSPFFAVKVNLIKNIALIQNFSLTHRKAP